MKTIKSINWHTASLDRKVAALHECANNRSTIQIIRCFTDLDYLMALVAGCLNHEDCFSMVFRADESRWCATINSYHDGRCDLKSWNVDPNTALLHAFLTYNGIRVKTKLGKIIK